MQTTTQHTIQAGDVLIANPFLLEPTFSRTVILICNHDEEGSFGFVLNKPTDVLVNKLVPDFPTNDFEICVGGPVGLEYVRYVHTLGKELEGSLPVGNGLYWGGELEHLKHLVEMGQVTANNIRFFIGYAGWGSGQLVQELEEGSWVVAPADSELLTVDEYSLWEQTMAAKGGRYRALAELPEKAILN